MRRLSVLVMAGFLVGCGGGEGADASDKAAVPAASDGGSAASVAARHACELVSDAEVGTATGTTVESHEETGLNGCRWRAGGGTQLTLHVYSGSTLASSTCDAQKRLGTGREEPVSGLGESALWKTSGRLVVCAQRAVLSFNLDNSSRSVPDDREGLVTLARSALGRH